MLTIDLQLFYWLAQTLVESAVNALRYQISKAENGVHRRPQFVAHTGKKLRLVLTRQLQGRILLADFKEEARVLDRDRATIGEGTQEIDLPRAVSANAPSHQDDSAD